MKFVGLFLGSGSGAGKDLTGTSPHCTVGGTEALRAGRGLLEVKQ